jgi:hypothetical protein
MVGLVGIVAARRAHRKYLPVATDGVVPPFLPAGRIQLMDWK